MENSLAVPQKLNVEFPYDPVIALIGIYRKELKTGTQTLIGSHTNAQSSIIHNTQKMETTYVSINRRMDKQNGAYIQWTIIQP